MRRGILGNYSLMLDCGKVPADGRALPQTLRGLTKLTNMRHVGVRTLERSRTSLLVDVKRGPLLVGRQLKRRGVRAALKACKRLCPGAGIRITEGLANILACAPTAADITSCADGRRATVCRETIRWGGTVGVRFWGRETSGPLGVGTLGLYSGCSGSVIPNNLLMES